MFFSKIILFCLPFVAMLQISCAASIDDSNGNSRVYESPAPPPSRVDTLSVDIPRNGDEIPNGGSSTNNEEGNLSNDNKDTNTYIERDPKDAESPGVESENTLGDDRHNGGYKEIGEEGGVVETGKSESYDQRTGESPPVLDTHSEPEVLENVGDTQPHLTLNQPTKDDNEGDDDDFEREEENENENDGGEANLGFNNMEANPPGENLLPIDAPSHPRTTDADLDEGSSHFITYFVVASFFVIVAYLLYHNKQKVMAVIVEGRSARKAGGNKRPKTKDYVKLSSNIEEVITNPDKDTYKQKEYIY